MKNLLSSYDFSPLDWHLASALAPGSRDNSNWLGLAVALTSKRCREGHVCASLAEVAGLPLGVTELPDQAPPVGDSWPPLDPWIERLSASSIVSRAEFFDPSKPLVLSGERLYLTRYFLHEAAVIERIRERLSETLPVGDPARIRNTIERLYSPLHPDSIRQRLAVALALSCRLCVVTGGPGTGKTTAILRLLAVLIEQARNDGRDSPRVQLLAPTGKAASRIAESIRLSKPLLATDNTVKSSIPESASTLHRALGSTARADATKRRRLAADIVVVDEASMVDLALMRRLLDACVDVPRLVLLGDAEQLESVLAGSVLSELTQAEHSGYHPERAAILQATTGLEVKTCPRERFGLDDCRIELTVSHRFSEGGGISRLAAAVRQGNGEDALGILQSGGNGTRFLPAAPKGSSAVVALLDLAQDGYRLFRAAATPQAAIDALLEFRILCGHRRGPLGVESVNALLTDGLRSSALRAHESTIPILITENAPDLALFNGDIGVLWRADDPSQARRAFIRTASGELRCVSIGRLPSHEPAFAMTVHKSQGSEIDRVVFVLPAPNSPLLSRELLYTGITRARTECTILGSKEALMQACGRKTRRYSGLALGLARL